MACGPPTDDELIALAKKELAIIGLVTEDDVKDGCVVRQKKAYPVYDDSYKANVEAIRSRTRRPRIRRCISSAATACTSTTTRITP